MYFSSDYFFHHFDCRVELSQCSFTSCYGVMISSFEPKMYIFSKRRKVRLLSSLLMSSRSLECIKSILQPYTLNTNDVELLLCTVAGVLCESRASADDTKQCLIKSSKLQCLQVSIMN